MNIHEYQAKQLLAQYGAAVPVGEPCKTPDQAKAAAEKLLKAGFSAVVVKSQIHAGGRGKGTFKTGFQGGVKVCKTAEEAFQMAQAMLGNILVTKQTGPDGRKVSTLLVESAAKIKKEFYLSVLLDRTNSMPLIMASTEGGMDIEEVAAKTPEKILKSHVDPQVGLWPNQARKIASQLGLKGELIAQGAKVIAGVYKTWIECDAAMVEINPLCIVELPDGKEAMVCLAGLPLASTMSTNFMEGDFA